MPTDDVSSARSCSGSNDEKTTTWRRARVIATLSRRSPPTRFSGPKFSGSSPEAFTEKPVEKKTTSRSSPCTFSRFLTNRPSPSVRSSAAASRSSSASRSSASM
jgi:hypothetical protein